MNTTLIIVGMLFLLFWINKQFNKKPVPMKQSNYAPVRIAKDGTIICVKKIKTWG